MAAPFLLATTVNAADLESKTLEAFNQYVERAQVRATEHCAASAFLWIDSSPELRRSVRDGEIAVTPVGQTPLKVPNGLIHDWIGTEFIPDTTIEEVLNIVHDYGRYREFYAPLVINSETTGHTGEQYRFRMLMMNHALFSKSALDGEYVESFVRVDNQDWYSIADSTSMRQIDDYGEPDETRLAEGEGSGYIWRLTSISKFGQRDGGVYVQIEVIALSRGIPGSLHWLVDPIVRRVARGSLVTSLEKTRAAVNSNDAVAHHTLPEPAAPPVRGTLTSAWR